MGIMTALVIGETAKEEGAEASQLLDEGTVDYVVANCSEAEVRRQIPALFPTH